MEIEISGGTAKLGEHLCVTCAHSTIIEMADGKTIQRCHSIGTYIQGRVVRCNSYQHKNQPDMYQLKEIAWDVTADPRGRIGFFPPKKRDLLP